MTSSEMEVSGVRSFVNQNWIWLLVIGFVGFVVWQVSPPLQLEEPGNAAPDFALTTLEGDRFVLSEHRGEVVVLTFWATWCPTCRTELPVKQELHEELSDKPVTFVGLSTDAGGLETVRGFASERGLTFAQVADRSGLMQAYGAGGGVPTTVVVDQDGYIRFLNEGITARSTLSNVIDKLLEE